MSFINYPFRKTTLLLLVCLLGPSVGSAQNASQLAFSELQARANTLVERGQLEQARPLLEELVSRVEKTENSEIELDFPIFLIGTAYIQQYVNSGNMAPLPEAIKWYEKLEKEYPESPKIKDALLKKIDVYRVMQQNDQALALMKRLLSENQFRLSYPERTKLLKDITQTYYFTGKLQEGLPYFAQLLDVSRDTEEQALAAAASFEGLFEAKRMDDAIRLLPYLVQETDVRYRPRLNVALLKASDILVDANRLNDAALLLNLIKTTDLMIQYHESEISTKTARLEQRKAFGNAADEVAKLEQEIAILKANLEQLRKLPTLRNELLVRRARNYTKSERSYEAFWMFYDLMSENPNHEQSEFYTYAAFSNALNINKENAINHIGDEYRSKFPEGEYYSDVSIALASRLIDEGKPDEFLALATDFLTKRPLDPVSSNLFAQWASYLLGEGKFEPMVRQAAAWKAMHKHPIYEDGIYYWSGLAELQLSEFSKAIQSFDDVLKKFPTSNYAEDALLRKGTALYYDQQYEESREILYGYVKKYPRGNALDQAYYFLGEVENLAGKHDLAIKHFKKADSITTLQDIHDGVAFRLGGIYESYQEYTEMIEVFETYIKTYGSDGRLTDAVYELGRGFEFIMKPTAMLTLYRQYIESYLSSEDDSGIDTLVEGYAEKYDSNYTMLTSTVEFLDRLDSDQTFREQIVTDRGFLFETFYLDEKLHQPLYNKLRNHPNFTNALIDDLSPIKNLTQPYRNELAQYPSEKPEAFFRRLLNQMRAKKSRIGEARALMGLYRIGIELKPNQPFDGDLVRSASPRVILYIADYEKSKRLEFAVAAWNEVLTEYPQDDAAIVALMRLAGVSEERNDLPTALNYLQNILDQFPGSPKTPGVILHQGELLTKLNRTKEAREKYQYILRVPDWRGIIHARALYQIGESYMAESAYAEAHGFFERTFLGYSHFAEWCARAYLADAEALVKMGAPQDAINTLTEAVQQLGTSAPDEIMQSIQSKLRELQS